MWPLVTSRWHHHVQTAWHHSPIRHDAHVLDEINAARTQLAAAVDAVDVARQGVRDAQTAVRARRVELHATIVAALRAGQRVNAVAGAAGLTREQIRRIARAGGVEPD